MNKEEKLEVPLASSSPLDDVHVITRGIRLLPLYSASQVSDTPVR